MMLKFGWFVFLVQLKITMKRTILAVLRFVRLLFYTFLHLYCSFEFRTSFRLFQWFFGPLHPNRISIRNALTNSPAAESERFASISNETSVFVYSFVMSHFMYLCDIMEALVTKTFRLIHFIISDLLWLWFDRIASHKFFGVQWANSLLSLTSLF